MRFPAILLLLAAGCAGAPDGPPPKTEPDRIVVQHLLVSFAGTRTKATRSKADAEALARSLLDRAKRGEDFDALVKQFTDDSHPGVYAVANLWLPPAEGEMARDRLAAAFGNVGFKLEVGGIGMAAYDPRESPFGWHVIKRLK
jgi:hypothetical protein